MYGLILATCLTVNTHCNDVNAPIRYDIIDSYPELIDCKNALLREPKARQELLTCEIDTPYKAGNK